MNIIQQLHRTYAAALREQDGERALWLRVLLQQAADATTQQKNGTAQARKRTARLFLQHYSNDFIMLCDYAGLHPARTFSGFQALFAMKDIPPMPPLDIKVNASGQLYIADWLGEGGEYAKKRRKTYTIRRKGKHSAGSASPSLFAET